MSLSSSSCTSEVPLLLNPDISGVGVRISFYCQTFLLVLLVDRSWREAPSALWTFIATSFGLTIAALVQAAQGNLTLFQALQVLNLVWLANFGSFLALASYSRRKSGHSHHKSRSAKGMLHKPENYVKFGAMLQTLLSMILTEWMWVHASVFNTECSPTVHYVLFVVKLNALGSGRIVGLILTSLLTAGYVTVTFHELRAYYLSYKQGQLPRHHRKDSSNLPEEKVSSPASPTSMLSRSITFPQPTLNFNRSLNPIIPPPNHLVELPTQLSTIISQTAADNQPRNPVFVKVHRPRRKQWSGNWDPMLLGIAAFQLVVFTYFVVSTELLLEWNPYRTDGNKWGFGQV